MSDKISDERLRSLIDQCNSQKLGRNEDFQAWIAEKVEIYEELLARRAAEVKPVKLPEIIQMDMGSYGEVPVVTVAELLEAIKAAGGTVEGDNG